MPKVSYVDLTINGNRVRYDISYNKTERFAIKGLPKELIDITHVVDSHYATEEKLIEAVESAIREYHNIISKQTKVIVYRIVLPSDMAMNKVGQGEYHGANKNLPAKLENKIGRKGFDNSKLEHDFGFTIEYEIMYEINDNGLTYWRMNSQGEMTNKKNLAKEHMTMKWSEQRERFFAMLNDNTKAMVMKILAFLGKEDDELLPLIDAGSHKLLT